jgi:broad specificity phosphatase PhoE
LDEPLEPRAKEEAAAFGELLGRADLAWTSPALRARETAEALSLDAVVDPLLRDCDYGRWAGRRLNDIHAEEPEGVRAWLADPEANPHGGESLAELLRRVAIWLDRHAGAGVHGIAVTHAAVIRAAILHVIHAPASSFWHLDISPLSVTDIRNDGVRWTWRAGLGWRAGLDWRAGLGARQV